MSYVSKIFSIESYSLLVCKAIPMCFCSYLHLEYPNFKRLTLTAPNIPPEHAVIIGHRPVPKVLF